MQLHFYLGQTEAHLEFYTVLVIALAHPAQAPTGVGDTSMKLMQCPSQVSKLKLTLFKLRGALKIKK